MICNSCRRSLISSIRRPQLRSIATAPATSNATAVNHSPAAPSNEKTPATSSTVAGVSQPLSTSTLPSTSSARPPAPASADGAALPRTQLQSSVAGGTVLKGLAYLKAKPNIIAKEDDEYPDWLWTLLDSKKDGEGASAVDLASLTKKQRLKYERKQARLMKDVPKPIPLHEQSNDLTQPEDSAGLSLRKRQEVTRSSRGARRKAIRESNFLKGM